MRKKDFRENSMNTKFNNKAYVKNLPGNPPKNQSKDAPKEAKRPNRPYLAYRIVCVEHENPNYAGRFRQNFYTQGPVRFETCSDEAEEKREQIQNIYGGRWIVENPSQRERELETCEHTWGRYYITCTKGVKTGYRRRTAIKKDLAGNEQEELKEARSLAKFFMEKYGGTWRIDKKEVFASRFPLEENNPVEILGPELKSADAALVY